MASIEEARMRVALVARRNGEEAFALEVEAGAWDKSRNDIQQCQLGGKTVVLKGERFWCGDVSDTDDLGGDIVDEFVDGKSNPSSAYAGAWAIFNPDNWQHIGVGRLGTGLGQRYKKLADGRWLKVEG